MSLTGKLQKWVDAGLISSDQQTRIIQHEKGFSGDRWKHGIIFAGLFSILLGISLIVAANWQEISWQLKLVTHFAINIALACLVWTWRDNPEKMKHREVALFFLWGLTLTLIALMGQVFQMGGQAMDAVRVWFWLTAPMILLFAQSPFIARLWAIAFVVYLPWDIFTHIENWTQNEDLRLAIAMETVIGLPLATWLLGSWPRFASSRPAIGRALRNVGLLCALAVGSAAGFVYYAASLENYHVFVPGIYAVAIIGLRFLLQSFKHWDADERGAIDLLCLAGLFICAPLIAPADSALLAMIHFVSFWLLAGTIWQQNGHDHMVSVAIAVITLRLFAGFVELFGNMMMSGFGFIIGGLVLIGLVYGARAINKRLKGAGA